MPSFWPMSLRSSPSSSAPRPPFLAPPLVRLSALVREEHDLHHGGGSIEECVEPLCAGYCGIVDELNGRWYAGT